MYTEYPGWLSKEMVAGVRKFNLDAYLVALEGWRRGLSLKFYYDVSSLSDIKITGFNPIGKSFSLHNQERKHFFYRSRGDKVSTEAIDIGTNKQMAKKLLDDAGVNVLAGESFDEQASKGEIIAAANKLGYPLVLKSTLGNLSEGTKTDIQTDEQLSNAISEGLEEHDEIMIEPHYDGDHIRVYVIDDQVFGAVKKIPANLVGNGESNIEQLLINKNRERKNNPYLATRPVSIDQEMLDYLETQNYSPQSVLKINERVFLKKNSNIASGGETADITDSLDPQVKELAINALQAIPGLSHAGIDIISGEEGAYVIRVNPTAGIGLHIFPSEGQPRNIPEGIIDYYFPETTELAKNRTKAYFNYKKIRNLLVNREVKEVEVTDAPHGEMYAKRYVISGKVQRVGYRNWIHKQAIEQGLNGYVRNLRNGKVVTVVGSDDAEKVDAFKELCFQGPKRAEVEDIQEYEWDKRVKIGFEVKRKRSVKRKR